MRCIIQQPLFPGDKAYYLNVYVDLDGTLHKLPFASPMAGLWRFDGQFFYLWERT